MLIEEWDDSLVQMVQATHPKRHPVSVVRANHTAPKKLLERMQELDIPLVLYNREFREHLKSGGHLRVRIDANEEATFSVYKSNHPLRLQPPRLWLNVKSLRVLHLEPSLRIVPMSAGFLLPSILTASTEQLWRMFPHIVQFY